MSETLAAQVGPVLAEFLRWLVEGSHPWTLAEVLGVIDDPRAWQPEYLAFLLERRRASAPTAAQCESEERAAR